MNARMLRSISKLGTLKNNVSVTFWTNMTSKSCYHTKSTTLYTLSRSYAIDIWRRNFDGANLDERWGIHFVLSWDVISSRLCSLTDPSFREATCFANLSFSQLSFSWFFCGWASNRLVFLPYPPPSAQYPFLFGHASPLSAFVHVICMFCYVLTFMYLTLAPGLSNFSCSCCFFTVSTIMEAVACSNWIVAFVCAQLHLVQHWVSGSVLYAKLVWDRVLYSNVFLMAGQSMFHDVLSIGFPLLWSTKCVSISIRVAMSTPYLLLWCKKLRVLCNALWSAKFKFHWILWDNNFVTLPMLFATQYIYVSHQVSPTIRVQCSYQPLKYISPV